MPPSWRFALSSTPGRRARRWRPISAGPNCSRAILPKRATGSSSKRSTRPAKGVASTCWVGCGCAKAICPRPDAPSTKHCAHLPDDPELWVDIGRLRYRGGEQRQALEASEHALELDPGSARALEFRAQLERDARGPAAALPLYERAVARSGADADLLLDYAATLVDAGRATDALDAIRRATALNPATPRAFHLQAVIAARGSDWDLGAAPAAPQRHGRA